MLEEIITPLILQGCRFRDILWKVYHGKATPDQKTELYILFQKVCKDIDEQD